MTDDTISREKLKKHYAWWRGTENGRKMADIFDEIVDAQPPADVVERRNGKWRLNKDGNWACPFCEFDPYHDNMSGMNYCPNCGARLEAAP